MMSRVTVSSVSFSKAFVSFRELSSNWLDSPMFGQYSTRLLTDSISVTILFSFRSCLMKNERKTTRSCSREVTHIWLRERKYQWRLRQSERDTLRTRVCNFLLEYVKRVCGHIAEMMSVLCVAIFWSVNASSGEKKCLQFSIPTGADGEGGVSHRLKLYNRRLNVYLDNLSAKPYFLSRILLWS